MPDGMPIRDETRSISLDMLSSEAVADKRGGLQRGFTASGRINRGDWGLTWNVPLETGGWLVSEEVQIQLDVAAFGPKFTSPAFDNTRSAWTSAAVRTSIGSTRWCL